MARNNNAFAVRKCQRKGQQVWELVTANGQPVEEAERFIHTLVLRGLSPRTRRTYAYDLLEAYRWMTEADRQPEQCTGDDLVAFIDYMQRPPPASPSTINRRLRRIFRYHRSKSGITQANPHRFRHSFGANMTRCRVPLLVLARMMGHSSPQTTMRYVEIEDAELRDHYLQALDVLKAQGLLREHPFPTDY